MARTSQRVFALTLALLFLVTSVGASGVVLWQVWQQDKAKKTAADATKTIQDSLKDKQSNETKKEGKMEGTKLANFTPVDKIDALKSEDITAGTGEEVKPGATVTAHYTGALAKDGTIFQSSHDQPGDQPIEFPLSGVIKGWTEGVPGMKVGGKRRLYIPAAMAYGDQSPSPNIPANSDLVFDIELTAVKNP